ncbi:MAG: 2-succinylbenzoate-CoA ligase [Bacilli bacterium]|nr:2-succinylbenzoate-CoA ligase [Bacilli bacterium]
MGSSTMKIWLTKRAELTPNRTALIDEEQQLTFAELHQRVTKTALQLIGYGIKQGDAVALLLQNGVHTVILIHALQYAGAVTVLLNTRLAQNELVWQLEDSGARLLVYDEPQADKVAGISEHTRQIHAINWQQLNEQELHQDTTAQTRLQSEVDLDAIHTLIYTSGTTGHPKGVMLSYGNHWWSAIGSSLNMGLHLDDRWLLCLPMFHVSGLSILLRSVIFGISVVIHEQFDPDRVNQAILEQQVTIASVVGAMLARIVERLNGARYPDTFRCMLLGGGPAPAPLLESCIDACIPVFQTYGLTETASQIVTLSPEYMLSKSGSAGKPLFPADIKIEQDGQLQAAGDAGEIVVKGPNVTKGYYLSPDATERAIRDGWLYTGDMGYLDEDGFLYVLDRRSDLIISGGENVYPAEIEAVLLRHPAVADAGVTGDTSERWGQVPVAFVRLRDGATADEAELLAFCSQRLAAFKVPVAVHFVSELPRNASNKLLRRALLDLRA